MCFPNTFASHFSLFEGEGGGGIQESGRILFCSPIVKTKKLKFAQSPVLFSGVKIYIGISVQSYTGIPVNW